MARVSKPPEERRQELIEVALRLFFTKGYAETSVRDILKEVNGAPGMFYYYFASKEEIFQAAIDSYVESYIESLKGNILNYDLSVSDRIKGTVKQFNHTFIQVGKFVTAPESPFNAVFHTSLSNKIINAMTEPFAILVKDAISCGFIKKEAIRTKTVEETIFYLIAGIYGIINFAISNFESEDYLKKPQQVLQYISLMLGIDIEALK